MSTVPGRRLRNLELAAAERRHHRLQELAQEDGRPLLLSDAELDDVLREAEAEFCRVLGPRSTWPRTLTRTTAAKLAAELGVSVDLLTGDAVTSGDHAR